MSLFLYVTYSYLSSTVIGEHYHINILTFSCKICQQHQANLYFIVSLYCVVVPFYRLCIKPVYNTTFSKQTVAETLPSPPSLSFTTNFLRVFHTIICIKFDRHIKYIVSFNFQGNIFLEIIPLFFF